MIDLLKGAGVYSNWSSARRLIAGIILILTLTLTAIITVKFMDYWDKVQNRKRVELSSTEIGQIRCMLLSRKTCDVNVEWFENSDLPDGTRVSRYQF
jgi:hypothetical protein